MSAMQVCIDGIGLWSDQMTGFTDLRALLAGGTPAAPTARPAAATLPPNERRRAPASVLLAVEVAGQAVAMSGRAASDLACVFASSHGDQAITDYMCAMLATTPAELSPTRFHNSVHNAAVGYWTMATGCHAPSTAVAAKRATFGAGLLEAVSQVLAEQRDVLLVCSDTDGQPPLLEMTDCTINFGCALVLSPRASATSLARLTLTLKTAGFDSTPAASLVEPLASWRNANPSAAALPLLALLTDGHGQCTLEASAGLALHLDVAPIA